MGIQIGAILSSMSDPLATGNDERTDFERARDGKLPGRFFIAHATLDDPSQFASVLRDREVPGPSADELKDVSHVRSTSLPRPAVWLNHAICPRCSARALGGRMPPPGAATSTDRASYAGKHQYDG